MEENQHDPVDQSENASGTQTKDIQEDKIPYSTFKKALNEKKNVQSENENLKNRLKELENEKLKAEGKKDELLSSYEQKIKELETKYKQTNQTYAWNTLTGKIKEEALKNGCQNPDKLIKLMDDEDLNSIEIGEDFSINYDSVKKVIEKNKKENFFLFSSSDKKIADGTPSVKLSEKKSDDIKNLSVDELKERIKQTYK